MKNMHHFAKAGNPPESFKSAWVLLLLAVFSACSDSSKSSNNITADASTQSEELSHHTGSKDDQASEYEVRRQQWVQQFDLDTNGFLDVSEREAMRKTPKPRENPFAEEKGARMKKRGKRAFALMPRIIGSRNTTRMEMEAFRAKSLKKRVLE